MYEYFEKPSKVTDKRYSSFKEETFQINNKAYVEDMIGFLEQTIAISKRPFCEKLNGEVEKLENYKEILKKLENKK